MPKNTTKTDFKRNKSNHYFSLGRKGAGGGGGSQEGTRDKAFLSLTLFYYSSIIKESQEPG